MKVSSSAADPLDLKSSRVNNYTSDSAFNHILDDDELPQNITLDRSQEVSETRVRRSQFQRIKRSHSLMDIDVSVFHGLFI